MDIFSPNSQAMSLADGIIEDITRDNNSTFVTVRYSNCRRCNRRNQTIRLVVDRNTRIFDESGNPVPPAALRIGMIIDASFSSATTRSIPPQAVAFVIRIVRSPRMEDFTISRILEIDRQNRSFTTISDRDLTSIIRFNVQQNTRFFDVFGRPMNFNGLIPGLRVEVRHANFMTASIPPQTTAFEVRVLR